MITRNDISCVRCNQPPMPDTRICRHCFEAAFPGVKANLSRAIEEARAEEEQLRAALLACKQHRQRLESLLILSGDEIINDCERIANEAFRDDNDRHPTISG